MVDIFKVLIGIIVLTGGYFLGNFLAFKTKEEIEKGQIYFKILTMGGLFGGFVGMIIKNDVIMFSLFFVAVLSSRSLKK